MGGTGKPGRQWWGTEGAHGPDHTRTNRLTHSAAPGGGQGRQGLGLRGGPGARPL